MMRAVVAGDNTFYSLVGNGAGIGRKAPPEIYRTPRREDLSDQHRRHQLYEQCGWWNLLDHPRHVGRSSTTFRRRPTYWGRFREG